MNLNRREFIRLMGLAGAAGIFQASSLSTSTKDQNSTTCRPLATRALGSSVNGCHHQADLVVARSFV